jgi:hypothetical protein
MRGFTSYLKNSRIALAAVGLGALLAGTTALSGAALADDHGHGRGDHGGHWDRGGHGDHRGWDRGDHWRAGWHEGYRRHYYPYYRTGYVYYPGYGYYDPYYDAPAYYPYPAYPAGVSFGFNFR